MTMKFDLEITPEMLAAAKKAASEMMAPLEADVRELLKKVAVLREAWLDLPFEGIVPKGWGDSIAALVNAATEIVDPDRTLRETEEAQRRGNLATLKAKAEWYADQFAMAHSAGMTADAEKYFADKRDEAIRGAREQFGIDLIVPTERRPWSPEGR